MTLTTEQLDELEAKLRDPHEYPHGIGTRASLHLVAVYRAALAWSEALTKNLNGTGGPLDVAQAEVALAIALVTT